jgi:putative restriction endonuclease
MGRREKTGPVISLQCVNTLRKSRKKNGGLLAVRVHWFLATAGCIDWRPGAAETFRAIEPGAPFLFKLHSPLNYIAGGGFFLHHSVLPLNVAWDCFRESNGASSLDQVRRLIQRRRHNDEPNPAIGCTILTEPFFFRREDWIPVPRDWSTNIVSGKTYDTSEVIGRDLWQDVQLRLQRQPPALVPEAIVGEPRYGEEYIARARLGQGGFRLLVTEAYHRRCAITGERTLPVLDAIHIRPYAEEGPHRIGNGILLRSDLHTLFDAGYITVTPDHRIRVSRRIREEFDNGREYYAFQGERLKVLPDDSRERPDPIFLEWHNANRFAG